MNNNIKIKRDLDEAIEKTKGLYWFNHNFLISLKNQYEKHGSLSEK